MSERRTLYPAIEPYKTNSLQVSNLHTLYYEEVGNHEGVAVVFLHGGPGVGAQPLYRRFFHPERFRVINFSQRGAGKSSPSGELQQNDTWALVEDIEKLRQAVNVERWFVFGGSWGSTLALAYAQQYPERVRGLVLRGIFLGTRAEHNWLYVDGASRVHPESWQRFQSFIPPEERSDLPAAYYQRLTSIQREVQMAAAEHWYHWEESLISLLPREAPRMAPDELLAFARIECHYIVNRLFLPDDNYLLNNAHKIAHLPCWIAQGRYDIICPVVSAINLCQHLPEAELHIVPDAGHAISQPGIVDSLMNGIEALAERG